MRHASDDQSRLRRGLCVIAHDMHPTAYEPESLPPSPDSGGRIAAVTMADQVFKNISFFPSLVDRESLLFWVGS